ncbi:MAG: hypothetical protein HQK99_08670 [Nitrospirae bacterium]|nr:hypothetical protein [Nitrospirota bacterium]
MDNVKTIDLSDLGTGEIPTLRAGCGLAFAESAGVCFEEQGHYDSVELRVEGDFEESFRLALPEVTDQMRRCYADKERATEDGAYGVAIMLILNLTDYTVVEKSRKGTAFDYWLGKKDDYDPFNKQARLEVSGILKGNDSDINYRSKNKLTRLQKQVNSLPAFIIIVEFSKPKSNIKKL